MDEPDIWKMLDTYFKDAPDSLVSHNLESYNEFFKTGIYQIFKEKNPIRLESNYDKSTDDYKNKCEIYLGGRDGTKISFGKPIIYDSNDKTHYMFPNEARLRNMTYGMSIHYDVEIVYTDILDDDEIPKQGGRPSNLDESTETHNDYKESYNFKNYKQDGGLNTIALNDFQETFTGGARNDNLTVRDYDYTTNQAKNLREKLAKSMKGNNICERVETIENVYLGKFPIMVQSDFCILNKLTPEIRFTMGECKQDLGGYFIIAGKEKTVVSQEKFADNMLYVRKLIKEDDDELELENLYSAELRSVSENPSKPVRKFSISVVAPNVKYTNYNIVVNIPNVRKPVPLFILMRALGIISDKDIINTCLLDLDKYEPWLDDFIPSVHDAGGILTQELAINYIALLTKGKLYEHGLEILSDYVLPHVGETNYKEKAYFIGHMVFKILSVMNNVELPTDRDNFKYKRIELAGSLMYELFRDFYTEQQKHIRLEYDKRLNFNLNLYASDLSGLINTYKNEIFRERIIEKGFSKAFKGNWGAKPNTKRIGVVQDLNRLSFNGYLSHLRKTNLPFDSSAKVTGPRHLHGSQWGFLDPLDTPDGGNIGLHKHLAIMTQVSHGGIGNRKPMIEWLREKVALKYTYECSPKMLSIMTKVFINGYWCGSITEPFDNVRKMKLYRRNGLLSPYTSIGFDITQNTILIYTDGGRLCRPIFYKDEMTNKLSYDNVKDKLSSGDYYWNNLVFGFNKHKDGINYKKNNYKIYELNELFSSVTTETNPAKLDTFIKNKGIIDYIDSNETENAMICLDVADFDSKPHTHLEIHPSLMFGTMGSLIVFPENNPPTRNAFSCGQSKQACSVYHSNYNVRIDKAAVLLNYGQTPLVKTRFLEYINKEEMPYGENTIVAIMCYGGYNMEDSVLINEGSLQRGLFNTTYFTGYEAHEEITESTDGIVETKFANIESNGDIMGVKIGYDYSKLDKYGIIREGTIVNDKTILIGMFTTNEGRKVDASKGTKKGQMGIVDKTFITESEEGERIVKVRIRDIRIPTFGDKVGSRHGQKGTCGLVVPEVNMPFTRGGMRPDIIINPHAIPSRMTIGQLVETTTAKASVIMGGYGDGTAFINKGSKVGVYGEALSNFGYHSSGNEIMYNGQSGEQLEMEIFIGPTYYMRLKHMAKDKINYRALGPVTALTKQPVSGRANDGGLRIGEMERDSLISHGVSDFLRESMMERSDKYRMAVCNKTGMMAIYNPDKKLFISPMIDGPIKFSGSVDGNNMNIINVTKHGRDFSIVDVPYSFKLLLQELNTINMQMRIITDDNIGQFDNMTFSNNMELLGVKGFSGYRLKLKQMVDEQLIENKTPPFVERTTSFSPSSGPSSGPSSDPSSDGNQPFSPPYAPSSDGNQSFSPPYAPSSDGNKPFTPDYAPSPESVSTEAFDNDDLKLKGPVTPNYPPPSSPSSSGGGGKNYELGKMVYYRGANGRDQNGMLQKWQIIKGGNKFITIKRDTQPGKPFNPMNDVKIVQSCDIYNDSEIIGPPQMFQTPNVSDDSHSAGNNITFAPIIKINTKDVMDELIEEQNEPIMMDDSEIKDDVHRPLTESKSKETIGKSNDTNDTIETPIDFSKGLKIIKKL
jgi:DNA-directed RNA polymerase II subunit RPB2